MSCFLCEKEYFEQILKVSSNIFKSEIYHGKNKKEKMSMRKRDNLQFIRLSSTAVKFSSIKPEEPFCRYPLAVVNLKSIRRRLRI
jgi:hypothetical protein